VSEPCLERIQCVSITKVLYLLLNLLYGRAMSGSRAAMVESSGERGVGTRHSAQRGDCGTDTHARTLHMHGLVRFCGSLPLGHDLRDDTGLRDHDNLQSPKYHDSSPKHTRLRV
jgi:hypothetical protein